MEPEGEGRDRAGDRAISVFPVLLVNFIGALGYSIILPFLVFLVTRLEGNALVYGLLGATYPAFQLVGAPLLGRWSDRFGRRRILLLSQAGTALSWLVFCAALFLPATVVMTSEALGGLVLTLPVLVLFMARALDGLTGGNISVANAYLADITAEKDRNTNFGRMSIASNLGYMAGPALAGLLGASAMGELAPALAALAVSIVGTVVVARLLPEPDPCPPDPGPRMATLRRVLGQEHRGCVRAAGERGLSTREVLGLPGLRLVLAVYFLVFLGFNFFYTAFPVHAARGLGWSIAETGAFFGFLSVAMVVVQGPILARLSKRVSEAVLIVAGNAILGAGFPLLASGETVSIYLAATLFALGNGIMWPSVLSLMSKLAGQEHQGAVQGVAGAIGGLASIVGLVAGGLLYESLGASTFLVSSGALIAAAVLSLRLLPTRGAPASVSP